MDLFIIGGGINGTAIAADAAGRGLSVMLCEKGDLAAATSSASTKLIHGGFRYLESYEFRMVRKAIIERAILMRRASNLITPLEFILPHESHLRSRWFIRLGLFIYDHLTKKNSLPHSKIINFKKNKPNNALLSELKTGFSYYDCVTDDARLVILNALLAKAQGATLLTHTQFLSAEQQQSVWKIQLKNLHTDHIFFCYAKSLINATGPWVADVQKHILPSKLTIHTQQVKGSHIIVPQLYAENVAYVLQHHDGRIVFTIPYQDHFTLIGTTDVPYTHSLEKMDISMDETHYLCDVINHYFQKKIMPSDVVWSFAGVRSLQFDENINLSKITRDYKLLLDHTCPLPLLAVIGGKLTTHRVLAEAALDQLKPFFPHMGSAWTANQPLPGCDFEQHDFSLFYQHITEKYTWLPQKILHRYATYYGTRIFQLLNNAHNLTDLGIDFGAGLYQKEVEFLIDNEWAESSSDILWRRTKLGLVFSAADIKKLDAWLHKRFSNL